MKLLDDGRLLVTGQERSERSALCHNCRARVFVIAAASEVVCFACGSSHRLREVIGTQHIPRYSQGLAERVGETLEAMHELGSSPALRRSVAGIQASVLGYE